MVDEKLARSKWRSHTPFVLTTVTVSLFTDLFLYGLIIPILPFLLEYDACVPPSQVQSYTSGMLGAYAGATVVFSPLAGWVADKAKTRQAPFLFGLICLLGATVLLFVSRTIVVLVLARVLQGISCAFVWTIGLAICMDTVGPEKMGQTIGTIFSVIAIGVLWAPFLGGLLYKRAGMQGVMAVAISVLAIDLVLRLLIIEKKTADKTGYTSASRNKQPNDQKDDCADGEVSDEEQALLGEAEGADKAFRLADEQPWIVRAIPILPCLSDPSLLAALFGSLVHAILMGSFDATVANISHELFDFDSFQAGLLFLPIGIMNLVCGPIVGWVVDRHGTKTAAVFAFGIMVPVLLSLRVVRAGGAPQFVLYAVLLCFAGIGLAGAGTPSIVEAGAVIDRYYRANGKHFGEKGPYAMVYGMNGMVFNAGLTIGPALAGGLKDAMGYGNMNVVLAAISGVALWLCFLYMGSTSRPGIANRENR